MLEFHTVIYSVTKEEVLSDLILQANTVLQVISCHNLLPVGVHIKRGDDLEHVLAFYEPVSGEVYFNSHIPQSDLVREAVIKHIQGSVMEDTLLVNDIDWDEINVLTAMANVPQLNEEV